MFFKNKCVLIVGLLLAHVSLAAIQTNDAEYNNAMVEGILKKSDRNQDKRLTTADEQSWGRYATFDTDGNQDVTKDELLNQVDALYPDLEARTHRNIVYKSVPGELLVLDIHYPLARHGKQAPVFYYTHGGGWTSGAKEPGKDIKPLFDELLKQGVACVSVQYRLVKMWREQDPVRIRDCIVDCQDGLRFLKKHEDELELDLDHVVVFGQSAGGHIAQLLSWAGPNIFEGDPALASYSVQPVAGISWFGPSDFRDSDLFIPEEGIHKNYDCDHWANRITKATHIYEDSDQETLRLLEEVSPVFYLTSKSVPLLHLHGDQDNVIPAKHAHLLSTKATELDLPITVEIVEGARHGWSNPRSNPSPDALQTMTVDYVLKHVTPAK